MAPGQIDTNQQTTEGTFLGETTLTPENPNDLSGESTLSPGEVSGEAGMSTSSIEQTPGTSTSTSGIISQSTPEESPVFDSTPDLNPTTIPPFATIIPDLMTNLPTAGPHQPTDLLTFKFPAYKAMLPERQYGNRGSVVNLKPAPLKEGLSDVIFGLETNDPKLPFFVRNQTGELIAFDNVDREQVQEYRFNVTVGF